jgi:hypothetical protein
VLGGKLGSLPKERRFRPGLPSGLDVQESWPPESLSFLRRKTPPQRGQRCRRDRPLRKPPCATAAVRRVKQLPSAYKESSPFFDPQMDAA